MAFDLYPFQEDTIEALARDYAAGLTHRLAVLPTGAGKTVVGMERIDRKLRHTLGMHQLDACKAGHRALWIAHREELIFQPYERMLEMHPEWKGRVGRVMGSFDEHACQIVVATVQTLSVDRRLQKVLRHGNFSILTTDEAHHSVSPSYIRLIETLTALNPKLDHVGLTATPVRSDGDPLARVFQACSAKYEITDLMALGHLVDVDAREVATHISVEGIKTVSGDFEQGALARVVEVDNALDLIVETYKRTCPDRPALAFVVSVKGAHALAEKFNKAGIPAAAVDGGTDKDRRRALIGSFRRGALRMLVSVGVFTEGTDLPMVSCILQARPTKSVGLYMQILGRGLRKHPGKADCLLIDFVPEERELEVGIEDVLGEEWAEQRRRKSDPDANGSVTTAKPEAVEEVVEPITGKVGSADGLVVGPMQLFRKSPYSWFFHDSLGTLGLGVRDGLVRSLAITRKNESDGLHRLLLVEYDTTTQRIDVDVLERSAEYARLVRAGEKAADDLASPDVVKVDRAWQRLDATVKQLAKLDAIMTDRDRAIVDPKALSRGQAQQLTDHILTRQRMKRYAETARRVA